MKPNPYQAYRQTQITTASGLELIILLYNGAITFLKQARVALEEKQVEPAHRALIKAQDIITELSLSLNREAGGEIADSLGQLYDYMDQRLVQANIQKEVEPVDEVIGMLEELRDTWEALGKDPQSRTAPAIEGLNIAK